MGGAVFPPFYLPGTKLWWASLVAQLVKNLPAIHETSSIPGLGKFSGEGNFHPLQYSCLENSMGRGTWQAIVRGATRVRHNLATKPPLNCGGGNEDNGDLPQKIPGMYYYSLCPQSFSRPPLTHAFARDSQTHHRCVSCGVKVPFSWVLVHRFCCALQESISQSYVSSGSSVVGLMVISSKTTYAMPTLRTPVPIQPQKL